jgi:hypothetical protein
LVTSSPAWFIEGGEIKSYKPGTAIFIQPVIFCGSCGAYSLDLQDNCHRGGFYHLIIYLYWLEISPFMLLRWTYSLLWACTPPPNAPKRDSSILILVKDYLDYSIQPLRAGSFGHVFVSELSASRQRFAEQCGIEIIYNSRKDDIAEKMHKLTVGLGIEIIFDYAGIAV